MTTWTTPEIRTVAGAAEVVAVALTPAGELRCWMEDREDDADVTITLHDAETGRAIYKDGRSVSTDDTQTWPTLERVLPRNQWPHHINAGAKYPAEARNDVAPELVAIIDAKLAEYKADAEAELAAYGE